MVACRERRTALAAFFVGRVEKLEQDLGRREGNAVELEVAQLLHHPSLIGTWFTIFFLMLACQILTVAHAVGRRVDQAHADGERPDRGAEVAAVARPVDQGLVDGDLAEQIVDVAAGALGLRQDDDLAGARGGAAHAVGVLAVAIGAADHPHQDAVACRRSDGRSSARKNTPMLVPPRM